MEAPEKVYIDDLAVVNDCATKISLKQLPNFSEYIRKDALLEWVKTERAKCSDETHPYAQFMNVVINKLNSK